MQSQQLPTVNREPDIGFPNDDGVSVDIINSAQMLVEAQSKYEEFTSKKLFHQAARCAYLIAFYHWDIAHEDVSSQFLSHLMKADNYYQKAYEHYHRTCIDSPANKKYINMMIGSVCRSALPVFFGLKSYFLAKKYCLEALNHALAEKNPDHLGYACRYLAIIYGTMNNAYFIYIDISLYLNSANEDTLLENKIEIELKAYKEKNSTLELADFKLIMALLNYIAVEKKLGVKLNPIILKIKETLFPCPSLKDLILLSLFKTDSLADKADSFVLVPKRQFELFRGAYLGKGSSKVAKYNNGAIETQELNQQSSKAAKSDPDSENISETKKRFN